MDKNHPPFLSIFSHELKSPLNIILNLAKLIDSSIKNNNDNEKIKKYISLIISQATYMKNYILNTIELGKIRYGNSKMVIEEVELVELLYEIIELTKILIENKPISIKTELSVEKCHILSDSIKLKQILLNIASNSAKFTKKGYISFTLQPTEEIVLIKIQDTGIGFRKKDLEKIFDFYCSNSNFNERIFESSGLGLYITNELLKNLNGRLSIESEYGKGTTVYISIPRKTEV